jgi:hypothetical protein
MYGLLRSSKNEFIAKVIFNGRKKKAVENNLIIGIIQDIIFYLYTVLKTYKEKAIKS